MRSIGTVLCTAAAIVVAVSHPSASGPVGIYGVIEKVIFEPDARSPERIQLWGVFAYADGDIADSSRGNQSREATPHVSAVERGYLYFKLPAVARAGEIGIEIEVVKREWADLASLAGTGQAIAFGRWGYIGRFAGLRPDTNSASPPYILERAPRGGARTDLRVRPASEAPASPAAYETNAGIVKLGEHGSHAAIVARLRDRLRR